MMAPHAQPKKSHAPNRRQQAHEAAANGLEAGPSAVSEAVWVWWLREELSHACTCIRCGLGVIARAPHGAEAVTDRRIGDDLGPGLPGTESVDVSRSSIRYSKPTSFRNVSRVRISSSSLSAMSASSRLNSTFSKNAAACSTVIAQTSVMDFPERRTARASERSRVPWQSGQIA